jgi:ABC-type transport system substrate-binding protein
MIKQKKAWLTMSFVVLLVLTILPLNIVNAQDETLFDITIIAPGNANMLRRQWGQIIANSLQQLGINARVVYLGWAPVYDRVFTPPEENVGKTYDEGGFDIMLVGWTPGLIPEASQLFYGSEECFAPTGNNYYLFNNTEANALMDEFITTTDQTELNQIAKELQEIFYEELPASQIFYSATPTAITPELGGPALGASPAGDGWLYFNAQPNPEMITGKTSVVYASTGEIESLIPPLSNSWYDTIIAANIFGGLVMVAPDLSDYTVPNLLTNWEASENNYKWTFTCRTGVKWHDGADFTADDVVFSLWALMNPDTGTQHQGSYTRAYGDNVEFTTVESCDLWGGTSTTLGDGTRVGSITAVDETTIEVSLPDLLPGKPYGYFDPYLLGFANNIIPKHIFEKMVPADWTDSPFNTGEGSIDIGGTTYTGPVGTGPYKWVNFDPVAQLVHLQKFDGYWNRTALEADGLFEVEDYYIRFIADKTPALAALKNEEVDILDPQYSIQVDIPTIDPDWGKVLLNEGTGRQEVGYNHQHPIIGTGVDTPLGKADPSRAAEAAMYVRIAIDYAIPRQLIIDNLMAGYGQPGVSYWLPTYPYYDDSITARPYDLAKAREYLQLAGYGAPSPPSPITYPSFILGSSAVLSGIYTDPETGNPVANRELALMQTTNNATYNQTTTLIDLRTTDLNGFYTFTVTPPNTGTYYYYLFDSLAIPAETEAQWRYLSMIEVTSFEDALTPLEDLITDNSQEVQSQSTKLDSLTTEVDDLKNSVNTMTMLAVAAILIAIILGLIAIWMARKKP